MKNTGIMLCLACIFLCGCGNQTNDVATDPGESTPAATEATFDEGGDAEADQQDTEEQAEEKQENDAVENDNRKMIAEALGIEEDHRKIRFILRGLETANAGAIQKAETTQENDFTVLKVVAEDGTNLSVYLTDGYSLNSVKNDDTGEWLVKSEM